MGRGGGRGFSKDVVLQRSVEQIIDSLLSGPGQVHRRYVEQIRVAWIWCAVLRRDRFLRTVSLGNLDIVSTSPLP